MWGRPSCLLQSAGGEANRILLASALSSMCIICSNRGIIRNVYNYYAALILLRAADWVVEMRMLCSIMCMLLIVSVYLMQHSEQFQ